MFDQDLQDLYQQVILDHGRKPRNFRELDDASAHADGFNPLCGDQVTVFVKIAHQSIEDVCFTGKGCAICTASASMMTQVLKTKSLDEANQLFQMFHALVTGQEGADEDELGKLSVFTGVRKYPVRIKCATLPWHTFKASLAQQSQVVSTE